MNMQYFLSFIISILSKLCRVRIHIDYLLEKLIYFPQGLKWLFWYSSNRIFQFSRLVTNTSVLPSLFIGLITIWISMVVSSENGIVKIIGLELTNIKVNYIFGLLLFFTSIFGGRYFFRSQTPEQYAQFSIDGREITNSFTYISYLIWKECKFVTSHKALKKKMEYIISKGGSIDKSEFGIMGTVLIKAFIDSINKRVGNQEIIKYSYGRLANSLNVPIIRLSDHFFQFNPHIFVTEFRKVCNTLEEINIAIDYKKTDLLENEMQNERAKIVLNFFKVINNLMNFQKSIIKYEDLHHFIIGMSGTYGSSNALRSYTLGLETVMRTEIQKKNRYDRIKFLFHKRRMYPGFDVHISLMNLARIVDIDSKSKDNGHEAELKKLYLLKPEELRQYDEISTFKFKRMMSSLVKIVNEYIAKERKSIVTKFRKYVEELNLPKSGKLILVTQGYSSVVNSTITTLLRELKLENELEKFNLRIFLLIDDSEDKILYEKTRYVRYKFKMNPDLPKELDRQVLVKAGDIEWLSKRYDKPINRILILSGAEFFQEDLKYGYRLINNEKSENILKQQKEKFKKAKIHHIILSEEYKKFERHLGNKQVYQDSLNRDHLEYLNLYDWDLERIIITGKKVYMRKQPKIDNTSAANIEKMEASLEALIKAWTKMRNA